MQKPCPGFSAGDLSSPATPFQGASTPALPPSSSPTASAAPPTPTDDTTRPDGPRQTLPPPSPPPLRHGRPTPRPAARSRKSAAPSPSSSSSSSSHREALARNGLARLAPIAAAAAPFSPPATVPSASAAARRSPTTATTTTTTTTPASSPFAPAAPPPNLVSPAPAGAPAPALLLLASPGHAAHPPVRPHDDIRSNGIKKEDGASYRPGSSSGGSSGLAFRTSGAGLVRAPASSKLVPAPLASAAAMDKSPGPSRPLVRRPRARSPWAITLLTLGVSLLGALLLSLILKSLVTRQLDFDPKGCRMSYMRPSYALLGEFDTEHTRFASKYSLYLYREQGVDDETKLKGIPVLFIPGNAGSYKQVRPIAAEAANYFHDVVQHNEAALRGGARSLDFFTVDFNEDITAFHGQTLLDQAEYLNEAIRYILSLYLDPRMAARDPDVPDPTSVIVLGHSMGGVVARTMLIMPNYQSNSINTIVTLSAPHARSPVTFDRDIVRIYDDINSYWRRAYAQQWANNNPLWHVTLVSIAGGGLDTIVPSDYASLASLVPDTHGFTVFTTTIPSVWTSMDHQAILWCDQFRKVIARALFDVVDVHRATQTKPRAERMRVFKKHFLTGLETIAERDAPAKEPTTLLTLDDQAHASARASASAAAAAHVIVPRGERLVLRGLGDSPRLRAHLLPIPPIPPHGASVGKRFTLLTDQPLDKPGDAGKLEVLFCSVFPLQSGQPGVLPIKIDLSGESAGPTTRLACKSAAPDVIVLPASRRSSRYPFTLADEREAAPFSYLQYDIEHIADHQFVAVLDKASAPTPGFVMAEFSDNAQAHHTRDIGLRRLLTFGLTFRLPATRPMVTEIQIPAIQSSLLAYRLEIGNQACGEEAELFTPLVRQYLSEPFESKYYVNARQAGISIHGVAPYMPPPLKPRLPLREGEGDNGLTFQFWTDPTCNSSIHVRLTVDVMGSLGMLYMRYRTVFAAFPVLVVALVLQRQFRIYDESGIFISFSESLDLCLRKSIPVVVAALTVLSLSGGNPQSADAASAGFWTWRNVTDAAVDFHRNDLLAGTQDPFYWFLVPLISVICIAACTAINYATLTLTHVLGLTMSLACSRPGWVRHDDRRRHQAGAGHAQQPVQQPQSQQQPQSSQTAQSSPLPPLPPQLQMQQYFSPIFIQSTPRRRVITTAVLLLLVSTVIPYQFAYLVACLVQIATTVRALRAASDMRSTVHYNFYNYAHSILILMLWILPINIPILAVWVRNLAVHWLTPFSSHHNVLSITPFIVLVETLTTGRMVPRVTTRLKLVMSVLLFGVAIAAAVYGVSYAYMIHHLVNVAVAWLVIVHSTGDSDIWSGAVLSDLFFDNAGAAADRKQGKSP